MRRQIDIAGAAAWEALVQTHTGHALQFIALLSDQLEFDVAVDRYLDELDVRDPMASAVRSRVLIALEHALTEDSDRPVLPAGERRPAGDGPGASEPPEDPEDDQDPERGLRRFRPDVLVRGIARKVREGGAQDQWVRLAVARAEEAVIRCHVDNALVFARLLLDHEPLSDAVDDYLELMRVAGTRGQSVHQRAMARLAEIHLPDDDEDPGAAGPGAGRGKPEEKPSG